MKKFLFLLSCFACLSILFVNCKDPGDDSGTGTDKSWYGVKKGSVEYVYEEGGSQTVTHQLYFDDYGKKERFDYEGYSHIVLLDKSIDLYHSEKKYNVYPSTKVNATYLVPNYDNYSNYAGYSKTTQTIAGKKVTIWTWTHYGVTYRWGAWERIPFLWDILEVKLIAKTFKTDIPSGYFDIPSDYTPLY